VEKKTMWNSWIEGKEPHWTSTEKESRRYKWAHNRPNGPILSTVEETVNDNSLILTFLTVQLENKSSAKQPKRIVFVTQHSNKHMFCHAYSMKVNFGIDYLCNKLIIKFKLICYLPEETNSVNYFINWVHKLVYIVDLFVFTFEKLY